MFAIFFKVESSSSIGLRGLLGAAHAIPRVALKVMERFYKFLNGFLLKGSPEWNLLEFCLLNKAFGRVIICFFR